MAVGSFKDLKVYKMAYKLATEIFHHSKSFPKEEMYSLTDQIRRSSWSVCSNIAEAYRRRKYPKYFSAKITDSDVEASETLVWLDFSRDCLYMPDNVHESLKQRYEEVGKMLGSMADNAKRFLSGGYKGSDQLIGFGGNLD